MKNSKSVMIVHEHIGFIGERLSNRFHVLKAWEPTTADQRKQVEAMVVAGDVKLDKEFVESFPNLGLIACFTAGYDGIDVEWASSRGIRVTHAESVNHEDVADHVIGFILAWARGLPDGDKAVRTGTWTANRKILTRSVGGLAVGIVGMGAIGQAIASRCSPFGMRVAWWGPREKPELRHRRASSLLALAQECDTVVVAASANPLNRHLIGAEVLNAIGQNGLFVNVARGSLVNEDQLVDSLRTGRLGAAALDVFATEPTDPAKWRNIPNVLLTPHTAGATHAVLPKLAAQLMANLEAFFDGRELPTPVAA
ncbi:2-hydroxyacid dehydrogenase [Rhizobium leguminosarum]|uniref:2-hydroxyacid dehydrogenase n=1 Tax=Rhizobium leguminosarum TaxID=384 RepID=UPI00048671F5|nr:2-hydroxyacid dehydrogenase [Rhizobium leguminosarum]